MMHCSLLYHSAQVVELMGEPVKLTVGEYTNLKLTTPEDMIIAETILKDRGERRGLISRILAIFGIGK